MRKRIFERLGRQLAEKYRLAGAFGMSCRVPSQAAEVLAETILAWGQLLDKQRRQILWLRVGLYSSVGFIGYLFLKIL